MVVIGDDALKEVLAFRFSGGWTSREQKVQRTGGSDAF